MWREAQRYKLALADDGLLLRTPEADFAVAKEDVLDVREHGAWGERSGRRWADVYIVTRPSSGRTHLALPPVFTLTPGVLAERLMRWRGAIEVPGSGAREPEPAALPSKIFDVVYHATLPLIAYLAGSFAITTLLMKNALMDNLSADYLRTAIAKGNSFGGAVRRHALRNSLIPIATSFGNNISLVLGGSFLIEVIFNIDGIGLLGYESLLERDSPVVMGILVLSSLLYLIGNILSDLCVAWVDPRIRFGER